MIAPCGGCHSLENSRSGFCTETVQGVTKQTVGRNQTSNPDTNLLHILSRCAERKNRGHIDSNVPKQTEVETVMHKKLLPWDADLDADWEIEVQGVKACFIHAFSTFTKQTNHPTLSYLFLCLGGIDSFQGRARTDRHTDGNVL